MGIYVQTYAARPKKKFFAKPLEVRIVNSARAWSTEKGLSPLFHVFEVSPSIVKFTFYPLNEPLFFEISEVQVSIGLKTSAVGAGYHAAFIDLCDHLGDDLGLDWQWQLSGNQSGDETEYAVRRDFENLREQHVDQIKGIANFILDNENIWGGIVNCSTVLIHDLEDIIGPRGYLSRPLLESYSLNDGNAFLEIQNKLLLWNDRETNVTFWNALLEGLFWCEYPWRPFVNSYESYIESCIEAAIKNGDGSTHSNELSDAVRSFRNTQSGATEYSNPGIGYLKKRLRRNLTGAWVCHVPGYLIESWDEESSTVEFCYNGLELRGSSMTISYTEGQDETLSWPDTLENSEEKIGDGFVYKLPSEIDKHDDDSFFGLGIGIGPKVDDQRSMVMFSVTGTSPEIVRAELEEQFRSGIRYLESK